MIINFIVNELNFFIYIYIYIFFFYMMEYNNTKT